MNLNFWKQFLSCVVLTLAFGGLANAQTSIDFTTAEAGTASTTGDSLDNIDVFPANNIDVAEDSGNLMLSIAGITGSTSTATTFLNSAGASFGIQSTNDFGTENTGFNGDESITISFNEAVVLQSVALTGLNSPTDLLSFGTDVDITQESAGDDDIFDFAGGGLVLAANEQIVISSGGGSSNLGISSITISAVPEPSSIALLGLLGPGVSCRSADLDI